MGPVTILELVGLSSRVLQKIIAYAMDVHHTPETINEINRRVNDLKLQLQLLESLEAGNELAERTKQWLDEAGVLQDSHRCLQELSDLLEKAPRPSRRSISTAEYLRRLIWPVSSQHKANQLLEQLDRRRDDIKTCIGLDTK